MFHDIGSQVVAIIGVICAVGLPLSIPIVYLGLNYERRRRMMELHHKERMAAIERGMEIPPLPSEVASPPPPRRSTLLPGLIWLLVGLALTVGLSQINTSTGMHLGVWGLVPAAVGAAYLLYYFLEGRKNLP